MRAFLFPNGECMWCLKDDEFQELSEREYIRMDTSVEEERVYPPTVLFIYWGDKLNFKGEMEISDFRDEVYESLMMNLQLCIIY